MSQALFTDEQNLRDVFVLAHAVQATGAAQIFTFRVPRACTIEALEYAVDTEGNADNVHNVDLRIGTTVLYSASPTAPDVVARDTTVAGGQNANRDAGEELNLSVAAPTGTTPASTGGYVIVWATKR